MKGEHIFTVYQDSDEDEWILTNKGVTIVGSKAVDTDFPFQYITQIKENIYLVADKGKLAQYNFRTKKLKFINIPCPHNRINTIAALGTDTLALGTDNGLILFSAHDNMFRQIDIRTSTQPSNYVEQIYQDRQKDVWVFPRNPGIVRLHLNSNEKEHLFTPQNEVIKHGRNSRKLIFEDKTGILWVLPTGGNLSYYDRKEKKLKPLLTDIDNPKSIFSPLVRFYTLDTQGNCWLATARGIDRISFSRKVINLIKPTMKRKRVLFCETATIVCGVRPKRVIFKYMLPMAVWKVTFPTKVPLSRKTNLP